MQQTRLSQINWAPVRCLHEPGIDLVALQRAPRVDLADSLQQARPLAMRHVIHRFDAFEQTAGMLSRMGLAIPQLSDDAGEVCIGFLEQFDLREANLRIEHCTTTTCPKFHSDCVHVRMVTTYAGPTTQYHFTAAPDRILSARPWDLLFLKGCKHANHRNSVLHRSPPMRAGDRRLCLILDY